jgi:stage II sporulation protein AA (anti-sigma F factor antagonist)
MLDPDAAAFDVRLVETDDGPLIVARGDLDLGAYDALRRCIEACCATQRHIVMDVAEVTFMDSTGLNALLWAHRRLGDRPGAVVLRNPSPAVVRVIELAGLTDTIAIESTPQPPPDG